MIVYILVGVIVAAVIIVLICLRIEDHNYNRDEKVAEENRRREFEELLTAAENGDTEAMRELFAGRYSAARPTAEQAVRYASAREQYQNWQNYEGFAKGASERYEAQLAAEGPVDSLKKFTEFVQQFRCLNDHNKAKLSEELRLAGPVDKLLEHRTRALYNYLVEQAETNREAFEDLGQLIKAVSPRGLSMYGYEAVFNDLELSLPWPERWNEWVLRHYDIPTFDSFAGLRGYHDIQVGALSDMAIKAVNSRDPLELAIVLAYCNEWDLARDEIGDSLYYLVLEARESTRVNQPSTVEGTGDTE